MLFGLCKRQIQRLHLDQDEKALLGLMQLHNRHYKNYETYYRSTRVQVFTISKYFQLFRTIFLVYLGLSWSISVYLCLFGLSWCLGAYCVSPCILVYLNLSQSLLSFFGLSRTILDYLRLSRAISEYLKLARAILDFLDYL